MHSKKVKEAPERCRRITHVRIKLKENKSRRNKSEKEKKKRKRKISTRWPTGSSWNLLRRSDIKKMCFIRPLKGYSLLQNFSKIKPKIKRD